MGLLKEKAQMTLLIIAIICIADIIARIYITSDGICYELPNGERKRIMKAKGAQANGKDA